MRPGDDLQLEAGSIVVELEEIDAFEHQDKTGYVPLTPVLWTWLRFTKDAGAVKGRYLLAAARRLDAANTLFEEVGKLKILLDDEKLAGPAIRRTVFTLVSTVELAVVALGRVLDMVMQASALLGVVVEVPATVHAKRPAVVEIRNAYEHIEDRALGQVRKKPHADALTIFEQKDLLAKDQITYSTHSLNLQTEVPVLIQEARDFLKLVAHDV